MAATLSPETLERIAEYEGHRHRRLLARAAALGLYAEPDLITGGWAVRSPRQRGYVEIVIAAGCTCEEWSILGNCPHAAVAAEQAKDDRRAA